MRTLFSSRGPGRVRFSRRRVVASAGLAAGLLVGALSSGPVAEAQDIETGTIAVGQPAPDFELRDAQGNAYRLSELTAKGPVVLEFFRSGGW